MRIRSRKIALFALLGAFVALVGAQGASGAMALRDMVVFKGQGESTIWGFGLVLGLNGTGDSDAAMLARQFAKLLEEGGSPIPDLNELADMQNVAMVMVTCAVPREGARKGDRLDVTVETYLNASSLEGGRLFIAPLVSPRRGANGERYVYAYAEGGVVIENPESPTAGRVHLGADITHDITMQTISRSGQVTLIVDSVKAGWTTTRLIADMINDEFLTIDDSRVEIARAINEREVVIDVPEADLADPSGFLATVEEITFDQSLLSLPARVVVNQDTGTISLSGNVEISPAIVMHDDLVITTVTPPREPTLDRPDVSQGSMTLIGTNGAGSGNSRGQDLINALKQLKVPARDQIAIFKQLHRLGHLHAEFIVE